MINYCCVCGHKAEGLIVHGEFVCYSCHREATGEQPPLGVVVSKRGKPRSKRSQIRDNLIAEHLKNKAKERKAK